MTTLLGKKQSLIYTQRSNKSEKLKMNPYNPTEYEKLKLAFGEVAYNYKSNKNGNGQIIVFVHGITGGMFQWEETAQYFYSIGYSVLTYDLFDLGESVCYSDIAAHHVMRIYLSTINELLFKLNITIPINLVGVSMGGGIAMAYAADFPEKVNKLCVCAPAGLPGTTPSAAKFLDYVPGILFKFALRLFASKAKEAYGDLAESTENSSHLQKIQEYGAYMYTKHGETYANGLLDTLRHFPLNTLKDKFKKVGESSTCVLICWGTKDRVVNSNLFFKACELIPNAKTFLLKGGGHTDLFALHKTEFRGALQNFLISKTPAEKIYGHFMNNRVKT